MRKIWCFIAGHKWEPWTAWSGDEDGFVRRNCGNCKLEQHGIHIVIPRRVVQCGLVEVVCHGRDFVEVVEDGD